MSAMAYSSWWYLPIVSIAECVGFDSNHGHEEIEQTQVSNGGEQSSVLSGREDGGAGGRDAQAQRKTWVGEMRDSGSGGWRMMLCARPDELLLAMLCERCVARRLPYADVYRVGWRM